MDAKTHPEILPLHKGEHNTRCQNGHDDHHEEEAGTAAGMVLGLLFHILHRERQSRLIAENRLMLGTMIGEDTAHILLLRGQNEVGKENSDLYHTFDHIVDQGTVKILGHKACQKGRQQHKQAHRHAERQHYGEYHQHALKLFCRYVFLQPQIQFGGLALLGEIVCRIHQRLHTRNNRA